MAAISIIFWIKVLEKLNSSVYIAWKLMYSSMLNKTSCVK